jgi:hypothetical protein
MSNIDSTLENRGSKYGTFEANAYTTQFMKKLFKTHSSWETMSNSQKEALEMIAHKIARILNGDPDYDDSWIDIAGYATLVAKQLKEEAENDDSK